MQNIFVEFLPPWIETGLQPAFYDKESGTVLQQVARMYAKVNYLVEMFNKFSKDTNTEIASFEQDTTETVNDYIARFIALKDFVDDYFDNLDVQEEINNKLDQMVEQGTLQEIVADYLNSKAVFGYDSVSDMKNATNLINGSFARTLGYHSKNDGGSGLYKIRTITNDDVVDEMFILEMEGDNSLIAELIAVESISPEQLGCVNNGTVDDAPFIQACVDYSKQYGAKVTFNHNLYYLRTGIDIPPLFSIDFQNVTLRAMTELGKGIINVENTENRHNGVVSNVILDQNNATTYGLYLSRSFRRLFENIHICFTPSGGIGIYSPGGTGSNQYDNITGYGTYLNSTLIYMGSNDSVFNHIDYCWYTIGLETSGFVRINDMHGFVAKDANHPEDWYPGSIFIKVTGHGRVVADQLYPDTHNYCFYVKDTTQPSQIGSIFYTYNENTPQNGATSVMFKAEDDNPAKFYRWIVDDIVLTHSPNVLFELIKPANSNTLCSTIRINHITANAQLNIEVPPTFVALDALPQNNFTKLGCYGDNIIATGTSQYRVVSSDRKIFHLTSSSNGVLADGIYPFNGIEPTNNTVFTGHVKVENNEVTILGQAGQLEGFTFTIVLPMIKKTIAS